jgi:hypothetical protein
VPHNGLDLLLVLGIKLLAVFRLEQGGGKTQRRLLQATPKALNHGRGQNVNGVGWELADVVGYTHQHARRVVVLVAFQEELVAEECPTADGKTAKAGINRV